MEPAQDLAKINVSPANPTFSNLSHHVSPHAQIQPMPTPKTEDANNAPKDVPPATMHPCVTPVLKEHSSNKELVLQYVLKDYSETALTTIANNATDHALNAMDHSIQIAPPVPVLISSPDQHALPDAYPENTSLTHNASNAQPPAPNVNQMNHAPNAKLDTSFKVDSVSIPAILDSTPTKIHSSVNNATRVAIDAVVVVRLNA